eukprot:1266900-Rhodomonas_salina.1
MVHSGFSPSPPLFLMSVTTSGNSSAMSRGVRICSATRRDERESQTETDGGRQHFASRPLSSVASAGRFPSVLRPMGRNRTFRWTDLDEVFRVDVGARVEEHPHCLQVSAARCLVQRRPTLVSSSQNHSHTFVCLHALHAS